jgi:hypothetical protein
MLLVSCPLLFPPSDSLLPAIGAFSVLHSVNHKELVTQALTISYVYHAHSLSTGHEPPYRWSIRDK